MINETQRKAFTEVVKAGYEKNYFEIVYANGQHGCDGLCCMTPNNAFYCLPFEAEYWEKTAEEYVEHEGIDNIYGYIANAICDMWEEEIDDKDTGEGNLYLLELRELLSDDTNLVGIIDDLLNLYTED